MSYDDAHDPDFEPGPEEVFDPANPAHHGAVDPDVYGTEDGSEDPETDAPSSPLGKLVAAPVGMILHNRRGAQDVLNRALLLGYVAKLKDAPQTVRELGAEMGVSHAEAHRRVTKLRAHFAGISREFDRIQKFRAR